MIVNRRLGKICIIMFLYLIKTDQNEKKERQTSIGIRVDVRLFCLFLSLHVKFLFWNMKGTREKERERAEKPTKIVNVESLLVENIRLAFRRLDRSLFVMFVIH